MATPFHVDVVTPERVLFSGDADAASMRTDLGEITFLAHHTELVGALDITVVTVDALSGGGEAQPAGGSGEASGSRRRFAVHGGFVHVAANSVTVLAGTAERGEDVDVGRARAALSAGRERLAREGPAKAPGATAEAEGVPLSGARLALLAPGSASAAVRRAEVRLEAAGVGEGG